MKFIGIFLVFILMLGFAGSQGAGNWVVPTSYPTQSLGSIQGAQNLGLSVAFLGDINNDGAGEILSSDANAFAPLQSNIHVINGATNNIIYSIPQTETYDFAILNDVNGDSIIDFALKQEIGGTVLVYSGSSGTLITTISNPTAGTTFEFGRDIDRITDVNADGKDDILVINPPAAVQTSSSIQAYIYDSSNGATLNSVLIPAGLVCVSISEIGDINFDNVSDFAVGCADPNAPIPTPRVMVYSGATATLLYTIFPPNVVGSCFGIFRNAVDNVGDFNFDGVSDFAVGDPCLSMGSISIHSGLNGNVLATINGQNLPMPANVGNFFTGGDVNGDAYGDLIIGEPIFNYVIIISGPNANVIYSWQRTFNFYGRDVAIGDVVGDGLSEVIVGAPYDPYSPNPNPNGYTHIEKLGGVLIGGTNPLNVVWIPNPGQGNTGTVTVSGMNSNEPVYLFYSLNFANVPVSFGGITQNLYLDPANLLGPFALQADPTGTLTISNVNIQSPLAPGKVYFQFATATQLSKVIEITFIP